MSATLTDHVRTSLTQKTIQATERYNALVQAAANNDSDFDPEAAVLVVEQAGKTAQAFDADVARIRQIRALELVVAKEPEVNERRSKLDNARGVQLEKDKAAMSELQSKMNRDQHLYNQAVGLLDNEERGIMDAKKRLRELTIPTHDAPPANAAYLGGFDLANTF